MRQKNHLQTYKIWLNYCESGVPKTVIQMKLVMYWLDIFIFFEALFAHNIFAPNIADIAIFDVFKQYISIEQSR